MKTNQLKKYYVKQEKKIRQSEKNKLTKVEKLDIKDYVKLLAVNQRRLYEMVMSLQQQILCLEVKIKKLERYCYGT